MKNDQFECALIDLLGNGIPLTPAPYQDIADQLGVSEDVVRHKIDCWLDDGTISRFGAVVRHHELGYQANAMVVWDTPDEAVEAAGQALTALPFVTLCYVRERRLPDWPYNLFCMIHGKDRETVLGQVEEATKAADLSDYQRDILFSVRRFKQRGAAYRAPLREAAE